MAIFPDYLTFSNYRATNHDKQLKKVRKSNKLIFRRLHNKQNVNKNFLYPIDTICFAMFQIR